MRNGTQKKIFADELLDCLQMNLNTQRRQKNQIFYWKESV